ncbi:hypothetical protein ACFLYQ_06725 [Chloroflexota bacterium]
MASKKENTYRILLFGDSFTAGEGVSNEYRYGDLLESMIDTFEVYNFGLPGSGTDQQYLVYKEFAAGIEHDLLLIVILVENIRRVAGHYRVWRDESGGHLIYAKPYFELVDGSLILKNVPPPSGPLSESALSKEEKNFVDQGGRFPGIEKLVAKLGAKDLVQKMVKFQPYPEYNSPNNPTWRVMQAILQEWINNHPGQVLLMPLPLYQHLEEMSDPSSYQARFREVASATGCMLYDPLPDLLRYPLVERRGFRSRRDPHLTQEGHAALATCLTPVLQGLRNSGG